MKDQTGSQEAGCSPPEGGHSAVASRPVASPRDYRDAVASALDEVGAPAALSGRRTIIIKPNIVNGCPPPVTTDWRCVDAVARYLSERVRASTIMVAEGSGEGSTLENMQALGFGGLNVPLVDLDSGPFSLRRHRLGEIFAEIRLPSILQGAAIVSVPSAKEHTITGVTLGLKNMVGCLPAPFYGGYWHYKKSGIHRLGEDRSIAELILYLEPDLTVIDARQGLMGGHLSGTVPRPPLGKVLAGRDVIAVDGAAARLLGRDPGGIGHLALAAALRDEAGRTGLTYNDQRPEEHEGAERRRH